MPVRDDRDGNVCEGDGWRKMKDAERWTEGKEWQRSIYFYQEDEARGRGGRERG